MSAAQAGGKGAAARRARYGVSTAVLVIAATISCVLAAGLASMRSVRWDLTATREFTLAPRTVKLLQAASAPTEIIISADSASLDPAARRRIGDLLLEFERAQPLLRSTWIDTGSGAAGATLRELMERLAAPHEPELSAQRRVLEAGQESAARLAAELAQIAEGLKALGDALDASGSGPDPDDRTHPRNQAGLVRTTAARLPAAQSGLGTAAGAKVFGVAMPAVDAARPHAQTIDEAARLAGAVAQYAQALQARSASEAVARSAASLAQVAQSARDDGARAADELARLRPVEALRVARALEASAAVIVATRSGAVALPLETLFPSGGASAGTGAADAVFAGEQLVATAVGSLFDDSAPIAVFVHAHNARLLDERGEPTPQGTGAFGEVFDRFRLTRVTPAEWPVATEALRPDLAGLKAGKNRPVYWIVLGAPPRGAADLRNAGSVSERNARLVKLGEALATLLRAGENVLACVEPSDLPALGERDPVASALAEFGVQSDSARVIVSTRSSPQGLLTYSFHTPRGASEGHPIRGAFGGLTAIVPWATPLERASGAAADQVTHPLLTLPEEDGTWAESSWQPIRELVLRGVASPLAPMLLADPPKFDGSRDERPRGEGGFVVALAAERPAVAGPGGGGGPQRLVVVGSPSWFEDGYIRASEDVAGRRVRLFPANLELLDAAGAWLAGQDERIAPGPQSRDVPRLGELDPGALRALHLFIILGMPALVLVTGGLLRVLRG
ncbi:MAG: hypothetical protein SFZ24_04110 [Planctomycetota bacterium]|nr:hypothetical protein [Planctomycetota bacterium]